MADIRSAFIPGAMMRVPRKTPADAIAKLQQATGRGATSAPAAQSVPSTPAAPSGPPTLGSWMTPEMRAQMEANMANPVKVGSLMRKAALNILDSSPVYAGHHMVEAGRGHGNILPYAALSGAVGGGAGYLLGDPVAGVGGGAGAALGGAAGNILGTGLGALGGAALGHLGGMSGAPFYKMMDQWAHGGSHVGNILGSLYGGYKGIGLARRVADKDRDEAKAAADRTLLKMGQQSPAAMQAYARAALRAKAQGKKPSPGVAVYAATTPTVLQQQEAQMPGMAGHVAPSPTGFAKPTPSSSTDTGLYNVGNAPNAGYLPVGGSAPSGFTLVTPTTKIGPPTQLQSSGPKGSPAAGTILGPGAVIGGNPTGHAKTPPVPPGPHKPGSTTMLNLAPHVVGGNQTLLGPGAIIGGKPTQVNTPPLQVGHPVVSLAKPVTQVQSTPSTSGIPADPGTPPPNAEPAAPTPPGADSTAKGLAGTGGFMPKMTGGQKALLYGGLGALGLGAIGSLGYTHGRRRVADREIDLRNQEERDFLQQQHVLEIERQRALLARLNNIYA